MTATVRKIDSLTRERLLEFANARPDAGERERLIDLAGKWKHGWIPLDEIAAAIKAKRMKGDGTRRPGTDSGVVSRAGKTRLDPKGAAKHAAIVNGARGKGKPRRAAAGDTMSAADRARYERAFGRPAGTPAEAAREAALHGSPALSTPSADHEARHAQIRREIKVRKDTRGGNVSFVAEHSNGVNTVSARIPQQRGKTDHEHRLAAREALAKGIERDRPDRKPAAAGGQPGGDPNVPSGHSLPVPGPAETHSVPELRNWLKNGSPQMQEQARAELARRAEAKAKGSPKRGLNDSGTRYDNPTRLQSAQTHPVGTAVVARQPGIDGETQGVVAGHTANGMVEVGYKDRHGKIVRGTFNPAHVNRRIGGPEMPEHPGAVQAARDKAFRAQGEAQTAAAISTLASRDVPDLRRLAESKNVKPKVRAAAKAELDRRGVKLETPEEVAARIGMTFPKPTVKGHTVIGEGTVERGSPGKAGAAAEPAAPAAPAKPKRKPSALHQEYRARREEQDRRFEAHAGGGVAATDTHTQEYQDYFGVGDHSTSPQEQRLTFKSFLEERRQGKEHERRSQQAYDAGAQLGAKHGEFEGDSAGHEAEYRTAESVHGPDHSDLFGQGYSDGVIAGSQRAEKRQQDNARRMAELEYGRARDAAHGVSKAAVTEAGHRAAVHAHVAAGRASLAAGRRPEAVEHIRRAEEHKGHADRLAAERQADTGRASTPDASPGPGEAPAAEASRSAGITVEHTGDGTLVHGTERGDTETTAALKAQGFKWSRNLGAWYLPRTWGEPTRDARVRGLEARLGDKITVQRGNLAKSTSGEEERAQRIARDNELAQKHTERAGKATAEAERRFDTAHKATEGIPFGQPILVGHHSQRRHERALEKSHSNMRAGVDAMAQAEDSHRRAGEAAARARLEEDPKFLARRLDRNQAEHRKVLRTLERADPADAHTQRLHAIRQDLEGKISADQAAMVEKGGGQHSKATITAGDVISYRGSTHMVTRTNAKTVTVPHWEPRLAAAGHTDTIPYSQIEKHVQLGDTSVKSESLRKLLDKPGTPPAIKSRIRAILRDRGETT